jgi:hypothetical protein
LGRYRLINSYVHPTSFCDKAVVTFWGCAGQEQYTATVAHGKSFGKSFDTHWWIRYDDFDQAVIPIMLAIIQQPIIEK